MGYKLKVMSDTGNQHEWFHQFLKESNFYTDMVRTIDDCVRPWGAIDLASTEYIEFETEQKMTIFLLKWSS